jgi:hypothetical protein
VVEEQIVEIGIDRDGRLYVRPAGRTFPYIYRAAMEVHWDSERGVLFNPKPREWSYRDWFRQILAAVDGEYRVRLKVGLDTIWSNVPDEFRKQIETDQGQV